MHVHTLTTNVTHQLSVSVTEGSFRLNSDYWKKLTHMHTLQSNFKTLLIATGSIVTPEIWHGIRQHTCLES